MNAARVRLRVERPRRRWLPYAIVGSLLVHAGVAWVLLPHGSGRGAQPTPAVIEVELVDQAPQVKGAPTAVASEAPPVPPTPDAKTAEAGDLPPPPSPPPRQAPPETVTQSSSVNLGGADEDLEGLVVTGRNVVPPRPDATIRNKPPGYPADAARRHAEGTVALRVHVAENGTPLAVDVVETSGDASLDRSAREAVALWRFQPAREGGQAVPFDYEMSISFRMGEH